MPRFLFRFWIVAVVLFGPIVFTADRFFVREYGQVAGYLIGFAFWLLLAAMSYLALWLFAQTFLQKRD
jgi:hypothetical protein